MANSLRLLNLPQRALEWLQTGHLTTGHAKVILGLENEELQEQAAQMVVENELNVRQTEALCKSFPGRKSRRPASRCGLLCRTRWSLPCARCWAMRSRWPTKTVGAA